MLAFRKIPLPGALYHVTLLPEKVIKTRRGNLGLLFFDLWFADPSLKNLFAILFSPRKKVAQIKNSFVKEKEIAEHLPASLIGEVHFAENGYEQTRVNVFRDISTTNELYVMNFKKWISAIHTLWTYGYHDQSMNFDINSGFDELGNCVLFDFNEFTDDFEITLAEVQNRKWYHQHPFWKMRFIGNQILRRQILEIIDREFTEENLRKLWGTNKKTV